MNMMENGDEYEKDEEEEITNNQKLCEMLDVSNKSNGSNGVTDYGIQLAGEEKALYVNSEAEDLDWRLKPARIYIDFKTYDDLERWLRGEYKDTKKSF